MSELPKTGSGKILKTELRKDILKTPAYQVLAWKCSLSCPASCTRVRQGISSRVKLHYDGTALKKKVQKMNNKRIIYVEGRPIQKLEYKGLPVVTFKMVDELHQHPSGLSFKSFNEHKDELKINKDFFNVPYEEWSQIPGINKAHNAFTELGPLILLTKSGYLTIAKSFMDDSSWDIQLSLIKDYFISKKRYQQNEDEENSSIDGETAGLWMLIKELMHTLNSVQYDLTRVRHDLQNFSIPPNEDSQNLLKKTATLLSIC